jgi:hypothetical protein
MEDVDTGRVSSGCARGAAQLNHRDVALLALLAYDFDESDCVDSLIPRETVSRYAEQLLLKLEVGTSARAIALTYDWGVLHPSRPAAEAV